LDKIKKDHYWLHIKINHILDKITTIIK